MTPGQKGLRSTDGEKSKGVELFKTNETRLTRRGQTMTSDNKSRANVITKNGMGGEQRGGTRTPGLLDFF